MPNFGRDEELENRIVSTDITRAPENKRKNGINIERSNPKIITAI